MNVVVSSVQPFPSIRWWCHILDADEIIWDVSEHFEKMSLRNRYLIAGNNGLLKMSIPLSKGRDQRTAMGELNISYAEQWQKQHWRTLFSAYNRSPFFEYYAPSLEQLFTNPKNKLIDFNLATIHWLMQQMNLKKDERFTLSYQKVLAEDIVDLRQLSKNNEDNFEHDFPTYFQVFEHRNGFLPNLSLLDLLFSEGSYTFTWLKHYAAMLKTI